VTPDRAPEPAPPVRAVQALPVDRVEFPALAAHLGLPAPALLSPLPDLCAPGARGTPRPIEEILDPVRGAGEETLRQLLAPLAAPDRVLDLRSAPFGAAPTPCRLFASRREEDLFVGVRPHPEHDRELLFPFSADDVEYWLQLQVQHSAGVPLPVPRSTLTGQELAFLLLVVDAYKAAFVASFARRSEEPVPVVLTAADLFRAQADAAGVRDRRWLATAVNEALGLLLHVGGGTQLVFPTLTRRALEQEIARGIETGWLRAAGAGEGFACGPEAEGMAADLVTWIGLGLLHDLQLTGGTEAAPEGREEVLLYLPTATTVWTLLSEGLTHAERDLGGVTFGLRALDAVTACEVARAFLQPAPDAAPPAPRAVCARPGCGATLQPGDRFCRLCGAPVS
jgi:hypothetical protein